MQHPQLLEDHMYQLQEVPFDGDALLTSSNGEWISVKRICEALGIDRKSQQVKIKDDPQFTWGDITLHDSIGRVQKMFCLPLSELNMWLCGINSRRVRAEIRPKLLKYQRECQRVLYAYFMPGGAQDYSQFMTQLIGLDRRTQEQFSQVHKRLDQIEKQQLGIVDYGSSAASSAGSVLSKYKNVKKFIH